MCVCVCVCVFLDLCMLCIYVERYFESLICCLEVCLSSLLVAFISMCFSSHEKPSFFKLDSFSTDPWQILFLSSILSLLSIASQQILDPSRFLGFFSIESWQLLRSSEPNFFALYLLNRFSTYCSIHWVEFCHRKILDSTSTDSFLSRLVLNRFPIETSIHWATFSIYSWGAISDFIPSSLPQ